MTDPNPVGGRWQWRLPGTLLAGWLVLGLLVPVMAGATRAQEGPPEGASGSTFRRAEGQREWRFPRDHGQHPAYRLEWWYYTGIVSTGTGRRFGYQVTFFRQGLPVAKPRRASAWAARSLYLAHAAVSDLSNRRYLRDERVGRDSLGLSGAAPDRHAVWLGKWRADALPDDPHGVRLRVASAGKFSLDLTLRAQKPPVLHGQAGLDAKGPRPGQASWYYSLPRLKTGGVLSLDGARMVVRGDTWMDHEFGTSQLSPGVVGWDWLALRLDDGHDLMLYRLRLGSGGAAPQSAGSWIAPDGKRVPLSLAADRPGGGVMRPGRLWRSPGSGGAYPLEWTISLPTLALELRVTPAFDAQEQLAGPGTPFAYWEGVVRAEGTRAGRPLGGEGYLELTGYVGKLGGALRQDGEVTGR